MNTGRTLFAQLMDFLPWSTFERIVARHDGNRAVRKLSCAGQFQVMAFAQLTYRESLRDIEACLSAQTAKLYHMGFREPVRRSTLADANETRDWRIYAEFAQRLIAQARRLYAGESLGVELRAPLIFRRVRKYRQRPESRRSWPRTARPAAAVSAACILLKSGV